MGPSLTEFEADASVEEFGVDGTVLTAIIGGAPTWIASWMASGRGSLVSGIS